MERPLWWKRELLINARRAIQFLLATEVALTEKSIRVDIPVGVC